MIGVLNVHPGPTSARADAFPFVGRQRACQLSVELSGVISRMLCDQSSGSDPEPVLVLGSPDGPDLAIEVADDGGINVVHDTCRRSFPPSVLITDVVTHVLHTAAASPGACAEASPRAGETRSSADAGRPNLDKLAAGPRNRGHMPVSSRPGWVNATPVGFRLARAVQLFVLVGVGYALGAEVSWRWFGASNIGLAFFPAAGVTVAALILTRRPWWPVILLAAGTAEFVVDVAHGLSPGIARRVRRREHRRAAHRGGAAERHGRGAVPSVDLTVRADAIRFSASRSSSGPLRAGSSGATVKSLDQGTAWFVGHTHWWAGDGLAVLAVGTPLVLFISRPEKLRLLRQFDGAVVLALTLAASFVSFGGGACPALVAIPVMIFAALASACTASSASGLIFAASPTTPPPTATGRSRSSTSIAVAGRAVTQLLLAVTIFTGWFLAMAIEERTRARARNDSPNAIGPDRGDVRAGASP